jgi:hypothetical protein
MKADEALGGIVHHEKVPDKSSPRTLYARSTFSSPAGSIAFLGA